MKQLERNTDCVCCRLVKPGARVSGFGEIHCDRCGGVPVLDGRYLVWQPGPFAQCQPEPQKPRVCASSEAACR